MLPCYQCRSSNMDWTRGLERHRQGHQEWSRCRDTPGIHCRAVRDQHKTLPSCSPWARGWLACLICCEVRRRGLEMGRSDFRGAVSVRPPRRRCLGAEAGGRVAVSWSAEATAHVLAPSATYSAACGRIVQVVATVAASNALIGHDACASRVLRAVDSQRLGLGAAGQRSVTWTDVDLFRTALSEAVKTLLGDERCRETKRWWCGRGEG